MTADQGRLEREGDEVSGVICGRCGAIVGPGHLSCEACGTLIASVVGGDFGRSPMQQDALPSEPEEPMLTPDADPDAVSGEGVPAPTPLPTTTGPIPAAATAPGLAPFLGAASPPAPSSAGSIDPSAAAVAGSYIARWSVGTPRFGRLNADPGAVAPDSVRAPRVTAASAPPPASGAFQPAQATLAVPSVPTVAAGPSVPAARVAAASLGVPTAGHAGLLADLPLDAPDDIPSWLVLVGSVVALASFVLPWATTDGIVLGTQGGTSYFDRWGLASLSDVGLFLVTLVVLGLAIVPNRLPLQFRFGYLPIVLGGVDLGVGWVYLGLTFGYGTGIVVLLVGGILLIAGSSLALRHPPASPSV